MPGLAKTNEFMLGTATVMIGPQDDLFELNPTEHSIGLVKNFSMTADPTYTELSQGVKNTIVYSVLTQNAVRASMEVYEFTAANIAYALGLSGDFTKKTVSSTVDTEVTTGSDVDVATGDGSNFTVGDTIMVKLDNEDDFVIREVTAISTDTLTVNVAFNQTLPAGSAVIVMNSIGAGSKEDQPFYSAKIAGKAANGEPVIVFLPKLRVVQGFNLAFSSDDFGNMPYEFTLYDLVSTDTHFDYMNGEMARIFRT